MSMSPKSGGARSFIKGLVHSRTNSEADSANPSDAVSSTELVGKQPRWLTKFLTDPKYRGRVLEELAERERLRAQHRKSTSLASTLNSSASPSLSTTSSSNSKKTSELQLIEFYATRTANLSENEGANRYADVLPYDRHSVFVNQVGGSDNLDGATYLNASWVKETGSQVWWIASQAPLPNTIPTFLLLCTSVTHSLRRPRVIVQLTASIEAGRIKAHEYLPARTGKAAAIRYPLRLPPKEEGRSGQVIGVVLEVVVRAKRDIVEAGATESILELTVCTRLFSMEATSTPREWEERGETTLVTHYYYGAWPDFGVPGEPKTILNLAKLVESTSSRLAGQMPQADDEERSMGGDAGGRPPVLVHCSAGVGRTGTFIAISSALRQCGVLGSGADSAGHRSVREAPTLLSPLGALPKKFDGDVIMAEIDSLREYRCMMVQRPEQVSFVYTVLGCALDAGA